MNMFIVYLCAVFLIACMPLYWLGIEQCSNRRRNLVPEESDLRYA